MQVSLTIGRSARLALCLALLSACDDSDSGNSIQPTPDAGSAAEVEDAGKSGVVASQPGASEVTIADGPLSGAKDDEVHKFLGIPYAKPPLGELRWKLAVKPDKWSEPRDATAFGKRCAQLESTTLMNPASEDEDCLYLNVWSPDLTPAEPLPVMFWIHGGGNVNGSASELVPYSAAGFYYSGKTLAEKGVVVVTFNYRLGAFGFFAHPAIAAETGGASANQGLLDQVAALKWVQDNIAKFGGDPKKVTIFGESAGSFDVCLHMASPKSRGMFHGAISQSGGCTTKQKTLAEAQAESGTRLATALGCSDAACLRAKSVKEILAVPATGPTAPVYGPVIDGAEGFLPDQTRTLFDTGALAKVPYMLGSNTDEGTLFTTSSMVADDAGLTASLTALFPGADVAAIMAAYPLASFMSKMNPQRARLARIVGDARLVCTTYDSSVRAAAPSAGLPGVWTYNFDVPVTVAPALELGSTHGAELTFVFGTSGAFTAEGKALSGQMQTYWTNFAKTGDPNGDGLPAWGKFSEASNVRMNLALTGPAIVNDFRAQECALWRGRYATAF